MKEESTVVALRRKMEELGQRASSIRAQIEAGTAGAREQYGRKLGALQPVSPSGTACRGCWTPGHKEGGKSNRVNAVVVAVAPPSLSSSPARVLQP